SCRTYAPLPNSPYDAQLKTASGRLGDLLTVMPQVEKPPVTGIIFYPGALVKPEAYLPPAWAIAEAAGTLVVIVPMPLNLAVLAPNRGASVPEKFPSIKHWFIAGHSLGGAMAASLAEKQGNLFSGLILLGAYPAKSSSLADSDMRVLSVYSEFDGLADTKKIDNSRPLLPYDTSYVMIKGGNHAGFGNYGEQKGDGTALITPKEQWERTAEEIKTFIQQ
ncbi:MAG: hypothetical protein PF495_17265, partial [Spirochaetales bacterium]|nr:hypothetical protein [Spirochaetales bacterium]